MLRVATLSSVLALVGCASQGDEGMIIINNTAVSGTACSLSGDPSQPFIAHGEIFVGSPRGYFFTPLIQSRLTAVEGEDLTQKTIYLTGANVSLEVKAASIQGTDGSFRDAAVSLAQAQFSSLFSASLPPNGTINVGFDIIPVQTLRSIQTSSGASGAEQLVVEVLATITLLGELGDDTIESRAFQFPVSVCNNCVVNNLGACPVMAEPRGGNACNSFQDGVVDCCVDAEGFLVCPALTATAAQ